jgi:hypothetical protein
MLAWAAFVGWLDWSATTVLATTVPATTLAAVAVAVLIRTDRGPVDALVVWALALSLTATAADVLVVAPSVDRVPGWTLVALGTALLAVAAGVVSARAGEPLRWLTAGLVVAAGLAQGVALEPGPGATVAIGTAVASTIGLALVFGQGARPASPWAAPTLMVGASAQAVGVAGAVAALPDRAGMIAVLLAVAAEAAALGVVRRSAAAMAVSPLMACAGWLTYAADALGGDPNWFTVPIGVALLGMSGGVRWVRRGRGADDDLRAPDIVMLDVTGALMLVAAASVQTVLGDLRYSLVVLGAGIGLVIWATVGRVRRRLALGVGAIVLAVGLLLVVPLVQAVPTMSGPALWITVAVIGLLIIVLATSLEQGRARVHRLGEAWRDLTSGWE